MNIKWNAPLNTTIHTLAQIGPYLITVNELEDVTFVRKLSMRAVQMSESYKPVTNERIVQNTEIFIFSR